ncbi:MAG: M3 family metallopeptidase [Eubacteriales bacterium]|nr:M3 family metallopeptidase [Eubacteriales bacterium]
MPPLRVQPFHSLTYQRPDLHSIAERYRRARLRMRLAMKPESAIHAVEEAQAVSLEYHSSETLAGILFDLQTSGPDMREELLFFQRSAAEVALMEQAFYQAMAATRFRDALAERFGERVFEVSAQLIETVQPSVTQELIDEQRLIGQYQQIISRAVIHLDGQTLLLSDVQRLLVSADRPTRQLAWQAGTDWYVSHQDELDRIMDQLIKVRTGLSRKLGFNSFVPVAARRLQRSGNRSGDMAGLRELVRTYIVPLTREIRRLQRRRLGLDHLAPWDLMMMFPDGDPQTDRMNENLPTLVAALAADLTGQHPSLLQTLLEAGYVDWQERPGKRGDPSCRMIYEAGVPFIQINGCRTLQDIFSLLHESGHAHAAWRSLSGMSVRRMHLPTADAAELHAMAMEMLSYPYLDRLFGREAETVTMLHMTRALLQVPADCMVDEFEYRIYAEPDLPAARRSQIWQELMAVYQPDLLAAEDVQPELVFPWTMQALMVNRPFSSISKVTGQLSALDLWHQSRIQRGQALAIYDQLCAAGGQTDLPELLHQAGLQSPFERDTIKRLVYQICDFLSL